MHWAEIICEIKKRDCSLSQIAEQENVTRPFVTHVVRGEKTSHKVAYAIAAITGIPTEKLWPGKYVQSPAEYKRLRGNSERGRLPTNRNTALQKAS